VGLVYILNSNPSLLVKLSSPLWFHRVSYNSRIIAAACLMVASFVFVGCAEPILCLFTNCDDDDDEQQQRNGELTSLMVVQLIGVALGSCQLALGEASFLALASCYTDGGAGKSGAARRLLSAWASGTGAAGPLGYLWTMSLHEWFNLDFRTTLLLGVPFLALPYVAIYLMGLDQPQRSPMMEQHTKQPVLEYEGEEDMGTIYAMVIDGPATACALSGGGGADVYAATNNHQTTPPQNMYTATLSKLRTIQATISSKALILTELWPYMVPLFLVYFAEYALQSGVWTVIGFPVGDESSREWFYHYSNWLYTAGVFISRTSGRYLQASMWTLWFMPALQFANLAFYLAVAVYKFWYGPWLLAPAFYAGLLGGAVYVNSFTRIVKDLPLERREAALSIVTTADTCGILVADVFGLYVQSCIYEKNGIAGALVECPLYR